MSRPLTEAAEAVCKYLDDAGLERVIDPRSIREYENKSVCRVCAIGGADEAFEAGRISGSEFFALEAAIELEMEARHDSVLELRTVPDRAAMQALYRAAAQRASQ